MTTLWHPFAECPHVRANIAASNSCCSSDHCCALPRNTPAGVLSLQFFKLLASGFAASSSITSSSRRSHSHWRNRRRRPWEQCGHQSVGMTRMAISFVLAVLFIAAAMGCAAWATWNIARKAPLAQPLSATVKQAPVVRDVTAAEAIAYICFGAWGRRFIDAANSPEISAEWAYRQFHQAAADGDIPTWAKRGGKPYEPIKREFWISNRIEWFELLKGWSVTRPIGRAIGINPRYVEVMTSRTATEGFFRNQLPEVLRAKSSARKTQAICLKRASITATNC